MTQSNDNRQTRVILRRRPTGLRGTDTGLVQARRQLAAAAARCGLVLRDTHIARSQRQLDDALADPAVATIACYSTHGTEFVIDTDLPEETLVVLGNAEVSCRCVGQLVSFDESHVIVEADARTEERLVEGGWLAPIRAFGRSRLVAHVRRLEAELHDHSSSCWTGGGLIQARGRAVVDVSGDALVIVSEHASVEAADTEARVARVLLPGHRAWPVIANVDDTVLLASVEGDVPDAQWIDADCRFDLVDVEWSFAPEAP